MPFVTHLFGNLGKRVRKVIPLTRVYKAYKVSTNYGYYGLIGKNWLYYQYKRGNVLQYKLCFHGHSYSYTAKSLYSNHHYLIFIVFEYYKKLLQQTTNQVIKQTPGDNKHNFLHPSVVPDSYNV